jgi:hypothetical protein
MAVRIPVVVSQSERRSGAMADYEEQLITRLIFENGLDATLVADLKSIGIDTTDHLCIEGLKGDFAIATWESKDYICEHLHRLGVESVDLVPTDGSPKHSSHRNGQPAKTIFFIALSTSSPIEKTISVLQGLREARSVPVFSLGGIKQRPEPSPTTTLKPNVVSISPLVSQASLKSNQDASPTNEQSNLNVTHLEHDDSFPEIDQLMLDLDRFEL